MLELKESLEEGINKEIEIFVVVIRKSLKSERKVIKKTLKLCKLFVISFFNPRCSIELDDMLITKVVNRRGL